MTKFLVYDLDESLHVCRTIDQYLKRTEVCRNDHDQLLLGLIKPHKPITSSKVSKWIVDMIVKCGIYTDIFKGHSTRSAATSIASSIGISLTEIIKRGEWSSISACKKIYYKEIRNKDMFQNIVNSTKELCREAVGDNER